MLLIFDLDDTLIHTHRVFLELTDEFLRRMAELGLGDENVYYTMDSFNREAVEDNAAYVPWAFPKAMRKTYEFYCEKDFVQYYDEVADELEELGWGFKEAEYTQVPGAKILLDEMAEAGHILVMLTQGGYDEQRFKVEQQHFNEFFDEIVVVDKKGPDVLRRLIEQCGFLPRETIVIGDSAKSDIAPALAVGAHAIKAEVSENWEFEAQALPEGYRVAHSMPEVGEIIREIAAAEMAEDNQEGQNE